MQTLKEVLPDFDWTNHQTKRAADLVFIDKYIDPIKNHNGLRNLGAEVWEWLYNDIYHELQYTLSVKVGAEAWEFDLRLWQDVLEGFMKMVDLGTLRSQLINYILNPPVCE